MERPPFLLGPGCAGVDPFRERFLFSRGDGAIGRHLAELDSAKYARKARSERGFAGGKIECRSLAFWIVAGAAPARKDGRRVDGEIGGET